MFWPIGSPRVYAATQHQLPKELRTISNDGLQSPSKPAETNGARRITSATNAPQRQDGEDEKQHDPVTQGSDGTPSHPSGAPNGTLQGTEAEQHLDGEIVGLRVARNGHIFATITRSTLTVWQAKVTALLPSPAIQLALTDTRPQAHRDSSFRAALDPLYQDIWSQRRPSPAPRLGHIRRANHARLLDNLLLGHGPELSRIQTTLRQ